MQFVCRLSQNSSDVEHFSRLMFFVGTYLTSQLIQNGFDLVVLLAKSPVYIASHKSVFIKLFYRTIFYTLSGICQLFSTVYFYKYTLAFASVDQCFCYFLYFRYILYYCLYILYLKIKLLTNSERVLFIRTFRNKLKIISCH